MQTDYVVGFLFGMDDHGVALIEKTKPEWQKGKLNGVGGKIEKGETPMKAMIREFQEETGCSVTDWKQFVEMKWQGSVIHFFVAHGNRGLTSMTEEKVGWYPVNSLLEFPILPNLKWLVPMALDKDISNKITIVDYS